MTAEFNAVGIALAIGPAQHVEIYKRCLDDGLTMVGTVMRAGKLMDEARVRLGGGNNAIWGDCINAGQPLPFLYPVWDAIAAALAAGENVGQAIERVVNEERAASVQRPKQCPTCRRLNQIVNQCGCDRRNLPTKVYKSRAAQQAQANGYGTVSYWDWLDEHAAELAAKGIADAFTRSLSDSLRGNEGT